MKQSWPRAGCAAAWPDFAGEWFRNTKGGLAVTFALLLPLLLGAMGVGADYLAMVNIRTNLQAVADGASLLAAKKLTLSGPTREEIRAAVANYLDQALPGQGDLSFDVASDLEEKNVQVTLSEAWTPFFGHFIGAVKTPVEVRSKAQLYGTANVCVLALHPSAHGAVNLTMLARMQANDCAIYANARTVDAVRLDLMGTMSAELICSAGGYVGLLSRFSPRPLSDCPELPDPLAQIQAPPSGSCDHNGIVFDAGSESLSPGVYCGGLVIKGTADVTLRPGTYVIRGGPFTVAGSARLSGANTGIYLEGEEAVIDFRGSAAIELSGQEEGPMAGLLFFEDRSASLDRTHLIGSTNARTLTGTIYLPRGRLLVNPNAAVAPDSAYTAIVARQLMLTQGPTLVLNSNYDQTSVPVPDGIKASSKVVLAE